MSDGPAHQAAPLARFGCPAAGAEAALEPESRVDQAAQRLIARLVPLWEGRRLHRARALTDRAAGLEPVMRQLSDGALASRRLTLAAHLRSGRDPARATAEALAVIRELADRTLGLRPFEVQITGAAGLLGGHLVEMATGEGKTLVAALAAGVQGLSGLPVHIVTVNDYLARRDAETMGPLLAALGLSAGAIQAGMSAPERAGVYACDVVYASNKEIVFDYLRDRLSTDPASPLRQRTAWLTGGGGGRGRLMRGLHSCIVDEADSVLVDEARTPLIISGTRDSAIDAETGQRAIAVAAGLDEGRDYRLDAAQGSIEFTAGGEQRMFEQCRAFGGLWRHEAYRHHLVRQSLAARHFFRRDEHYLVRGGKVQIIDPHTGRVMPDRSWNEGLHQIIEQREGCEASPERTPLASITYQRFFRRYRRLAGMSGTLREVGAELWSVYRRTVVGIPTNRRLRRTILPLRVFATEAEKWARVADRAAEVTATGRPVLIGARSVAASRRISSLLSGRGLAHRVLNAEQDAHEAEVVAAAGLAATITVATNMAGRGTDIKLAPGVAARGGLHVLICERHDARRIDRQLAGRCARQGDPGSVEMILSLEDSILGPPGRRHPAPWLPRFPWMAAIPFARAQRRLEKAHRRARLRLLRQDESTDDLMAFIGQRR